MMSAPSASNRAAPQCVSLCRVASESASSDIEDASAATEAAFADVGETADADADSGSRWDDAVP